MKYISRGPKLHVLRKSKQVNFAAITTRLFQAILKVLLLALYINQHKQWKPYRDTIFLIFFKEKTYDCCFKSQHTGIPPCLTSYNNLSKQRSSQISSKKLALFGSIFHRFGISLPPPCALPCFICDDLPKNGSATLNFYLSNHPPPPPPLL